jgi:hypothetical protein
MNTKSRENFGEFIRFFPEGLDPFKIHRKSKFESVPGFFNMNCVRNLKSAQLRKLFRILQCSLLQNLRNFQAMEGIHFEFTSLRGFWIFRKFSNWARAHL